MNILSIETSCDETACSIISGEKGQGKVKVLSSTVASSLALHSKTGGIIPETAAREQIKYIIPVIEKTLNDAFSSHLDEASSFISRIDALAVTIGPGLIGSLLVGIETAKTLAFSWNKPIVPVNHLIGHIYANFIQSEDREQKTEDRWQKNGNNGSKQNQFSVPSVGSAICYPSSVIRPPEFPAIVLIVSGGHTDLILMKNHGDLKWLGGTRDDAAGEALDKIGRILNLPYPGGPAIEKAAEHGNSASFELPRPMIGSNDFDFSFSGLKTAVLNKTKAIKQFNNKTIDDLCASVQQAIIDVLISKTLKAAKEHKAKSILLSGGVASNQKLRSEFELNAKRYPPAGGLNAKLFFPEKKFCTDNASMIGAAAFFNFKPIDWRDITVNPNLHFD